jgi:hypothetical protein
VRFGKSVVVSLGVAAAGGMMFALAVVLGFGPTNIAVALQTPIEVVGLAGFALMLLGGAGSIVCVLRRGK